MTTIIDTTLRPPVGRAATLPIKKATGKKASTPRTHIKTIYWRGDVIDVVNKFFVNLNYEPVPRPAGEQDWFWTKTWQKSIERSMAQINAGRGVVHHDSKGFLDSLGA